MLVGEDITPAGYGMPENLDFRVHVYACRGLCKLCTDLLLCRVVTFQRTLEAHLLRLPFELGTACPPAWQMFLFTSLCISYEGYIVSHAIGVDYYVAFYKPIVLRGL